MEIVAELYCSTGTHSVESTLWFSVFVGPSFRAVKLQNDYTMRSIAIVGESDSKESKSIFPTKTKTQFFKLFIAPGKI